VFLCVCVKDLPICHTGIILLYSPRGQSVKFNQLFITDPARVEYGYSL